MLLNASMTRETAVAGNPAGLASSEIVPEGENYGAMLAAIASHADKDSFVKLFRHFAPRVKSYLMKGGASESAADELAQETMLAVWDKAAAYDPRRAAASTWIFTIARNKRIDALRKRGRAEIDIDALAPTADEAPLASESLAGAQESAIIAEELRKLPEEQADLIRRSFFEGKSHGEIAAETGLPLGTVKSRMRLALERLRRQKNLRELRA